MTDKKIFYFLVFLTIGLLATSIWLYQRTEYLNTRLETLGSNVIYYCDSISKEQFEINQFKQDSYIRQQEHDTNLLLLVFGVVVGVISLFTWRLSKEEIELWKSKYDTDKREQDTKQSENQKRIEQTQTTFNFETYISRMKEAERTLDDDRPLSVLLFLSGLSYLTANYFYEQTNEPDLANSTLLKIRNELNGVLKTIGDDQFLMEGIIKSNIDGCLKTLSSINDSHINNDLWQIQLRLRYE